MRLNTRWILNLSAKYTTRVEKCIFVECFYGKEFSGDVKYSILAFNKSNPDVEIYITYSNDYLKLEIEKLGFNAIKFESFSYYQAFYKSKIIISNLNLYNRMYKTKRQTFIQLWHGYPIKRMVKELNDKLEATKQYKEFSKDLKKWDILCVNSDSYENALFDSFGPFDNIKLLKTKFERHAYLINNKDNKDLQTVIKNKYLLDKRKIILLTPTWRNDNDDMLSLNLEEIASKTNTQIIIKPHPHDNYFKNKQSSNSVKILNNCFDVYELLLISDVVISDYSSTIFDYLLIKDNVILHSEDVIKYSKEVGFKLSLNSVGLENPKKYTNEQIIDIINNGVYIDPRVKRFIDDQVLGHYKLNLVGEIRSILNNKEK